MFRTFRAALHDEINQRLQEYLHRKCSRCGITWDERIEVHQMRASQKAWEQVQCQKKDAFTA
jgi:hypothetical protein